MSNCTVKKELCWRHATNSHEHNTVDSTDLKLFLKINEKPENVIKT